jgi:hypothetical protein
LILNYEEQRLPTTSQEKKKVYNFKKRYVLLKMESNLIFKINPKKKKRNIQRKPMSKSKITLKNERKQKRSEIP